MVAAAVGRQREIDRILGDLNINIVPQSEFGIEDADETIDDVRWTTSDVALLSLHIDATVWPERLSGRSGYLVPKPVQRTVTAAGIRY